MRIVVDALAASTVRGGVDMYVRGLLTGWAQAAPEDRLTVLLTQPLGDELAADPRYSRHHLVVCSERAPRVGWRVVRAEALVPRLQSKADALLSTITSVPTAWRKPAVVVVHDLRHEERPADFSRLQHVLRRVQFHAAYRRADRLLTVSNRVAEVLRARHPTTSARIRVVHLAGDHVPLRTSTRDGDVVAFGHYSNKAPGLLLEVWQILRQRSDRFARRLHIVGLDDAQRHGLAREASRRGVADFVTLDSYMDGGSFGKLMAAAPALLLPSLYEGFGLPVLEGMRQGIPVMISPDPALCEVAAGHAVRAASWDPEDLATATQRALDMPLTDVAAAQRHSDHFTWKRTAELTRASVLAATRGDRSDEW